LAPPSATAAGQAMASEFQDELIGKLGELTGIAPR
jgi:hypothetical protein